jgi:hypothetical protein
MKFYTVSRSGDGFTGRLAPIDLYHFGLCDPPGGVIRDILVNEVT